MQSGRKDYDRFQGDKLSDSSWIDDAYFAIFEDWFASEEKISILEKPSAQNLPGTARYSGKFKRRCRELLLKESRLNELAACIFQSYALQGRFDEGAFLAELSRLVRWALEPER
jgi:hypothetical protein